MRFQACHFDHVTDIDYICERTLVQRMRLSQIAVCTMHVTLKPWCYHRGARVSELFKIILRSGSVKQTLQLNTFTVLMQLTRKPYHMLVLMSLIKQASIFLVLVTKT